MAFAGTTGTLKLEDPQAFAGAGFSGLSKPTPSDLSGVAYSANATATYLGNATGGALTVTDGTKTERIALSGNYLSSTWTLSSDGNGGTMVVDPTVSTNWQTLKVGGGGFVRGLDIAPDGTMVGRTDTNGAYLWNGTQWEQLVTSSSMPLQPSISARPRRLCKSKLPTAIQIYSTCNMTVTSSRARTKGQRGR